MKRTLSAISLLALSLVFSAQAVFAASLEANDYVFVNQPQNDDMYIATGRAEVNADIAGDLYIAAGEVVVSANVEEDLVVAGGRVSIIGNVGGDIRVLGGEISLFGEVGDDVVVTGGQVSIESGAVVGGSVIGGAGVLTISGDVHESVHAAVGTLVIAGKVSGDVVVSVQDRLNIDHLASIGGNLEYSSLVSVEVPDNVVDGKIVFNKFEDREILSNITKAYIIHKIFSFVAAILLVIVMVSAAPKLLTGAAMRACEKTWKAFGIGLLVVFGGILSSIILMMTLIGIPLAMVIFFSLALVFILAKVFAAAFIGSYFVNYDPARKTVSRWKLFFAVILGLFFYYLIGIIPIVGWIVNFVLFSIGVGAITMTKIDYMKFLKSKKMI